MVATIESQKMLSFLFNSHKINFNWGVLSVHLVLMNHLQKDVAKTKTSPSLQMAIRINESYQHLVEYCMTYQFSFRSEDILSAVNNSHSG